MQGQGSQPRLRNGDSVEDHAASLDSENIAAASELQEPGFKHTRPSGIGSMYGEWLGEHRVDGGWLLSYECSGYTQKQNIAVQIVKLH